MQAQVAIVSQMAQPSHSQKIKSLAYRLADDQQEDVYIISKPPPGMTYQPTLPYCVFSGEASDWEKANGERVTPRQIGS